MFVNRWRCLRPSLPSLEKILPELKTVLPNVRLRCAPARQADFVIEGYVDPTEPLRDEGPFGDPDRSGLLHVARAVSRLRGAEAPARRRPVFHVTAITHRKDAVYPATIVGMPPMEDFYIGGAALTRPAATLSHRMGGAGGEGLNFPEIVDLALPAEGVFHNLVFVSIRKTYPMQAYKIMHGLWGMGQMMFTK